MNHADNVKRKRLIDERIDSIAHIYQMRPDFRFSGLAVFHDIAVNLKNSLHAAVDAMSQPNTASGEFFQQVSGFSAGDAMAKELTGLRA